MTTATTAYAEQRPIRRTAWIVWVTCGLSVVVAGARVVLAIVDPASSDATSAPKVPGGGVPMAVFEALIICAIAGLGALLAYRRPQNPIGWIFCAIPLFLGILTLCAHLYWAFALGHTEPGGAAKFVAWLASWIWIPVMVPALTLLPLLFPTGTVLTPRWRWVQWVAIATIPTIFVGTAFAPGRFEEYPQVDNPVGIDGAVGGVINVFGGLGFALMLFSMVSAAASLVVRFRRSKGEQSEQIKWVAVAAVLFVVIFVFPTENFLGDDVGFVTLLLGLLIVAGAVAIAILKYRLYDIDVVISKTLLVAGLVGFITATYVAIVVGVGSLVGRGGEPNIVLSVAATTVVSVAFQPMRRWLQRVANRLVFGRRLTPYDVLSGFATKVGAGESSPQSLVHLAQLLADGTGADPARVWLRVGGLLRVEATWPESSETVAPVAVEAAGEGVARLPLADLTIPVMEHDELLGVLTIAKPRGERVTEVDVDLVERLAAASGVVVRNLRLDAELTERLSEIEASRRRLVSAQNDARRRIEAELAGGSRAQLGVLRDRLTALAADVDAAETPKTALLIDQLVAATNDAMATLTSLAAGVYPPRLAAEGLVAALAEQAAKAALPVSVQADGVVRYGLDVEAAAYFAVLEALQNVAKYAGATAAHVRLTQSDGHLAFEVTDDGSGFDQTITNLGTGLQGITDRLDTVQGTLTITSALGRGTTITGSIPTTPIPEPQLAGVTP